MLYMRAQKYYARAYKYHTCERKILCVRTYKYHTCARTNIIRLCTKYYACARTNIIDAHEKMKYANVIDARAQMLCVRQICARPHKRARANISHARVESVCHNSNVVLGMSNNNLKHPCVSLWEIFLFVFSTSRMWFFLNPFTEKAKFRNLSPLESPNALPRFWRMITKS